MAEARHRPMRRMLVPGKNARALSRQLMRVLFPG